MYPGNDGVGRQALLGQNAQRLGCASPWSRRPKPLLTSTKGTYLAAQYARIKGRHGHKKAIVAVAHSVLVIAYNLLEGDQPYNELGGDYFIECQQKDAYQRRLVKQLERMGYDVALTLKAA